MRLQIRTREIEEQGQKASWESFARMLVEEVEGEKMEARGGAPAKEKWGRLGYLKRMVEEGFARKQGI